MLALLIEPGYGDALPQSLLVQVESLEVLATGLSQDVEFRPDGVEQSEIEVLRVSIELSFPTSLDRQQRSKIQQVLRSFN